MPRRTPTTRGSEGKPLGAGGSSFELIDAGALFREIALRKGDAFLDLACGRGFYALAAAELVGNSGKLYALDLWREGIDSLVRETAARDIGNLTAWIRDIRDGIPLPDRTIDVCLVATVLHDFLGIGADAVAIKEIARVLKPEGLLAVVPPTEIRFRLKAPSHARLRFNYGIRHDKVCFSHAPRFSGDRRRDGRGGRLP
jgi:ubiquinone/menaquinone biosynthesis C-methylase UbiE